MNEFVISDDAIGAVQDCYVRSDEWLPSSYLLDESLQAAAPHIIAANPQPLKWRDDWGNLKKGDFVMVYLWRYKDFYLGEVTNYKGFLLIKDNTLVEHENFKNKFIIIPDTEI
jgi:hypothetical protein